MFLPWNGPKNYPPSTPSATNKSPPSTPSAITYSATSQNGIKYQSVVLSSVPMRFSPTQNREDLFLSNLKLVIRIKMILWDSSWNLWEMLLKECSMRNKTILKLALWSKLNYLLKPIAVYMSTSDSARKRSYRKLKNIQEKNAITSSAPKPKKKEW